MVTGRIDVIDPAAELQRVWRVIHACADVARAVAYSAALRRRGRRDPVCDAVAEALEQLIAVLSGVD
jgi:hypothetical protein